MENQTSKSYGPHSEVYQLNPDACYMNFQDAIEKRLRQAQAISFLAQNVACDDEDYILGAGTGKAIFRFLNELTEELELFFNKAIELKNSEKGGN